MGVPEWTLVAAALAVLIPLTRWILDKRDVSVIIGFRSGGGNFNREIQVPSGTELPLEALNLGGSEARNLHITITLPPDLQATTSEEWQPATPNPEFPSNSSAWTHTLSPIEGKGRRELSGFAISTLRDRTYVPQNRQPVDEIMWEVWWRFLCLKRGRGSDTLKARIVQKPLEHQ
jgi:hypothetical protein